MVGADLFPDEEHRQGAFHQNEITAELEGGHVPRLQPYASSVPWQQRIALAFWYMISNKALQSQLAIHQRTVRRQSRSQAAGPAKTSQQCP